MFFTGCVFVFVVAGLLAAGLFYSVKSSADGGPGMVFIYFLPLSVISLMAGVSALGVRAFRGEALTEFERGPAKVVGGLVLIGILLLGVAFATD